MSGCAPVPSSACAGTWSAGTAGDHSHPARRRSPARRAGAPAAASRRPRRSRAGRARAPATGPRRRSRSPPARCRARRRTSGRPSGPRPGATSGAPARSGRCRSRRSRRRRELLEHLQAVQRWCRRPSARTRSARGTGTPARRRTSPVRSRRRSGSPGPRAGVDTLTVTVSGVRPCACQVASRAWRCRAPRRRAVAGCPWPGTSRRRRRAAAPRVGLVRARRRGSRCSRARGGAARRRRTAPTARRAMRPAVIVALRLVRAPLHSTVNSSPPRRATRSLVADRGLAAAAATWISRRSPASCPKPSLTTLKSSRSRKRTATPRRRRARPAARRGTPRDRAAR